MAPQAPILYMRSRFTDALFSRSKMILPPSLARTVSSMKNASGVEVSRNALYTLQSQSPRLNPPERYPCHTQLWLSPCLMRSSSLMPSAPLIVVPVSATG